MVQMGKRKPQKKGTSQGSYSWLVTTEALTWGSGPLGLSSSSLGYCSHYSSLLEKGLRNKFSNVSRAQPQECLYSMHEVLGLTPPAEHTQKKLR